MTEFEQSMAEFTAATADWMTAWSTKMGVVENQVQTLTVLFYGLVVILVILLVIEIRKWSKRES